MRVVIFDDDSNELAQGFVNELKLDSRTRRVDIGATVMPTWRKLPDGGGQSAKSVMATLMDHLVASGKTEVSYSRCQPDIVAVQSVGLG